MVACDLWFISVLVESTRFLCWTCHSKMNTEYTYMLHNLLSTGLLDFCHSFVRIVGSFLIALHLVSFIQSCIQSLFFQLYSLEFPVYHFLSIHGSIHQRNFNSYVVLLLGTGVPILVYHLDFVEFHNLFHSMEVFINEI